MRRTRGLMRSSFRSRPSTPAWAIDRRSHPALRDRLPDRRDHHEGVKADGVSPAAGLLRPALPGCGGREIVKTNTREMTGVLVFTISLPPHAAKGGPGSPRCNVTF